MSEGVVQLDEAIREFREELKLAPADAATNLRLGMALVEARREAEALPPLDNVVRSTPSAGSASLSWPLPARARSSRRRRRGPFGVRWRWPGRPATTSRECGTSIISLRLPCARVEQTRRRRLTSTSPRAASGRRADTDREQLERYLADAADSNPDSLPAIPLNSPFAAMAPAVRADLERRVKTALARAYLNLGVMRTQAQQFSRAAELFEEGVAVDPGFPQLQYSLGVALFNAEQHEKAAVPLARALAADPGNADIRRMLALAHLNTGAYAQAAELLAGDSRLDSDPSLQYAYGLALARSEHGAEAEAVFTRLLAQHGDRAELHVILGQAHAQQGDFEAALQSLERARQLKPGVADASATLGMIYLKQGKLSEAAAGASRGAASNPGTLSARHTLATVLDLEAIPRRPLPCSEVCSRRNPTSATRATCSAKSFCPRRRRSCRRASRSGGPAGARRRELSLSARPGLPEARTHGPGRKALEIFRELKDKRRGSTP